MGLPPLTESYAELHGVLSPLSQPLQTDLHGVHTMYVTRTLPCDAAQLELAPQCARNVCRSNMDAPCIARALGILSHSEDVMYLDIVVHPWL